VFPPLRPELRKADLQSGYGGSMDILYTVMVYMQGFSALRPNQQKVTKTTEIVFYGLPK